MKKLMEVQKKLKAPKGQFNKFGGYHYRSCEDILEAAKPLCVEAGLLLTVSDEVVMIGERYYVKATAKVAYGTNEFSVTAYAREEETKKGMDGSQIREPQDGRGARLGDQTCGDASGPQRKVQ